MTIEKKYWAPQFKVTVNGSTMTFNGREPFLVPNEFVAQVLLSAGVYERIKDGRMRYVGRVCFQAIDGSKFDVDKDGWLEYDRDMIETEKLGKMDRDLKDSPGA